MGPLIVEVSRGPIVEARHVVHAVVVRDGRLELEWGDHSLVAFLRSSAKPILALPLARGRPDFDDEQIALACASHLGRPEQVTVVRRMLADAPASEVDLECGLAPTSIEHTCSGKHAGFLALCRANGWPTAGYSAARHPCQRAMLHEVAAAAEVDPDSLPVGIDGCGVPTFALSLERAAQAFARLPTLEGGQRVIRAMRANPELLRGPVAADAIAMRTRTGWFAKGGAEGLFCAGSADGLGVALKVEDGSFRPIRAALAAVLRRLGVEPGEVDETEVRSSRAELVGGIRVSSSR